MSLERYGQFRKCGLSLGACVRFYAFEVSSALNRGPLELLGTTSNLGCLLHNKKARLMFPVIQRGGHQLQLSPQLLPPPAASAKMPLNLVKLGAGNKKESAIRIVNFHLQGAFS